MQRMKSDGKEVEMWASALPVGRVGGCTTTLRFQDRLWPREGLRQLNIQGWPAGPRLQATQACLPEWDLCQA